MTVAEVVKLSQRLAQVGGALQTEASQGVPFAEWLPDLPALNNPGATNVSNVIPFSGGYRPVAQLSIYASTAIADRCQGAISVKDTAGNSFIYAGDANHLFRYSSGSWVDASVAGGYTVDAEDQWEFARFQNLLVAGQIGNDVQRITIGSTTFATLMASTNKPKAKHLAVIRNFLVLGNTTDTTDGAQPWRVWWSAIDDIDDFDPSATTQCDFEDLADGGEVQRVVGGAEYGLIFQDKQISRMTYAGTPLVFQFDPIDRARGTPIPGSVVGWGRLTFFVTEEGFFVNDGQSSTPIGHDKVDRTFWNQFVAVGNAGRVSAAVDPSNKLVMWSFPGSGATQDPNKVFIYNWADGRWSQIDVALRYIVALASQAYTLEELDAFSSNLDTLTPDLDDRFWAGGAPLLGGFGTDNKFYTFSGGNMAATIETGEFQPIPGWRTVVKNLRPLADAATANCAVASRARLSDTVTYGTAVAIDTDGDATLSSTGRYHRARVSISASVSWSFAAGIEATFVPSGRR